MSDETPRPRPRPRPVAPDQTPPDPTVAPAPPQVGPGDAAPSADAVAPPAGPDPAALQRRLALASWIPAGVLAVAAVVLLVLGLTVWGLSWSFGKQHSPDVEQRQEQVLANAKSC